MSKPKPERVIPQLLVATKATGKDRQSLYSEYIRLHWRTTGKLAPGCDAKDFYKALEELEDAEQAGAVDGGEGSDLQAESTPAPNPAPEVLPSPTHHH